MTNLLALQGRRDRAFDVAEKILDYVTLVELCHIESHTEESHAHDEDIQAQRSNQRLEYYIHLFKEPFAYTLYQYYLDKSKSNQF